MVSKISTVIKSFKELQLANVKEAGDETRNTLQAILITLEEILEELKDSVII